GPPLRVDAMPIDELMTRASVFIVGEYRDDQGRWKRGPIGTGFIVGVSSERWSDRTYAYVITCDHTLVEQRDRKVRVDVSLRRLVNAELFAFPTQNYGGRSYAADGLDLAVLPVSEILALPHDVFKAPTLDIKGITLDDGGSITKANKRRLFLGGDVYY